MKNAVATKTSKQQDTKPVGIVTHTGHLYCNQCAATRGHFDNGPDNSITIWSDSSSDRCDSCDQALR